MSIFFSFPIGYRATVSELANSRARLIQHDWVVVLRPGSTRACCDRFADESIHHRRELANLLRKFRLHSSKQRYSLWPRHRGWPRPWGGRHPRRRYRAIYRPVDADVIRAGALWPAVFHKIPESKPACSPGWDTADVDGELCPRFGISTYRVSRVDIQQEISEIADIGRCCPYVSARAISTQPNLQPIRKRIPGVADAGRHTHCRQWARGLHCTCVEGQRTAVLQSYFWR